MPIQEVARRNYAGERQSFILHFCDGIHEAVDFAQLSLVIKWLVSQLKDEFDYVISLDGPAQIPATALASHVSKPLRVATKADLDLQNKITFEEPGSPNPVFLYDLPPGRVVLVDNEIRTGRTVLSCIAAIRPHGIEVVAVLVPVGSTKYDVAAKFREQNILLLVHDWHDF